MNLKDNDLVNLNELNELNNKCAELILEEKYDEALKKLKKGETLLEVNEKNLS